MKVTIAVFLASIGSVFPFEDGRDFQDLSHDYVGTYHTRALEKLAEKYTLTKPTGTKDIIDDMTEIFDSMCKEGMCASYNAEAIENEYLGTLKEGSREVNYPENYHSKLLDSLEDINTAIEEVHELNIDEIIDRITKIKEEIEDTEDIDEGQKLSALVGMSVAIESTKLWHSVIHDEDHPLHFGVQLSEAEDSGKRALQRMSVVDVVKTDVNAAVNMTIGAVIRNPINLGLLPGLIMMVPAMATIASTAKFFISIGDTQLLTLQYAWFTDASIWFNTPASELDPVFP